MTFPIDEGVVRIDAEVDKTSIRAAATAAGRQAGDDLERSTRESFEQSTNRNRGRFSNILRKAVTPSADAFTAIRAPFAAALSTPIGAAVIAVAGTAALAFVGAFATALATAGLGALFLGIGVIALKENEKIAKSFETLGTRVKNAFAGAAAPLIAPLVTAMDTLGDAAERVAPLFRQIFATLAPAIPALTAGITVFVEEFLRVLTADPAALMGMRDALIAIGANLPQVGAALGELFALLATNENNVRNIGILFDLLVFSISSLGASLTLLSGILDYIVAGWTKVIAGGSAVIAWITGTFVPGVVGAWNSITSGGASLLAWFQALPGRIMGFIQGLPAMLGALFTRALAAAAFAVGYGIGTIIKLWLNMPGMIASAIASIPGLVAGVFSRARGLAVSAASSLVSGVVSILRTLPGAAASAVSSVGSRIAGALRSAVGAARGIGADIIRGLISGIKSMVGAAISAARSAVSGVISGAKSALGIGSPSKVFASIGVDTLRGLAGGLSRTQIVDRAMRGVVDAVGNFGGLGMSSPSPALAGAGVGGGGIPLRTGGGGTVNSSSISVGGVTVNVGVVDPDRAAQVGVDVANSFWDQLARTRTAR